MRPVCHSSKLLTAVLAGAFPVLACAGTASLSYSWPLLLTAGVKRKEKDASRAPELPPTCCDEVAYDLCVSLLAGKVQRVHVVLRCQLDVAVVGQQQLDGVLCCFIRGSSRTNMSRCRACKQAEKDMLKPVASGQHRHLLSEENVNSSRRHSPLGQPRQQGAGASVTAYPGCQAGSACLSASACAAGPRFSRLCADPWLLMIWSATVLVVREVSLATCRSSLQ
jgi:hypothetical protein